MTSAAGPSSINGWNVSQPALSVPELCAIIGNGWDCHGRKTSTGVLLELFRLPRSNLTRGRETCDSYILLPAENTWSYQLRAVLYAIGIFYCFIGLAAVMAKYMEAMANIVKQTRRTSRTDPVTGVSEIRRERIWNPTVADITLLALGSSSPQISLAMIDALQRLGQHSVGGVGPGTLVGSAAFNLFPVLAVCVLVPKAGAVKRIEKIGVFVVELVWSLWAYIWLYIMLKVTSPNRVTLWEAMMTVLQFPLLILHAYAEDRRWPYVCLSFWVNRQAWTEATGVCAAEPAHVETCPAVGSSSDSRESGHILLETLERSVDQGQLSLKSQIDAAAETELPLQFNYTLPGQRLVDPSSAIMLPDEDLYLKEEGPSLGERWRTQLFYAMTVPGSIFENGRQIPPTLFVLLKHALTLFWRVLLAFTIPADVGHGWPAFCCALLFVTAISAVTIQLANLLGCVIGISSYVIAITVLASGTSWPDLIASKLAVQYGDTADSGIANINCSNCINIFVGFGVPWLIQVCYNRFKLKQSLLTQTSGLSFSVIVFFITFALCWAVIVARRFFFGGELGGPRRWAIVSSAYFSALWLAFVILTCLYVYHVI